MRGDHHRNNAPARNNIERFTIQALSSRYLAEHRSELPDQPGKMVIEIPAEIDKEVAQRRYLYGD